MMSDGNLKRFDIVDEAVMCNTGGFDMRKAMAEFDIL